MRLFRAPGALCARSCASCCRQQALARCAARQPTHAAPRVRRAQPCLATGSGEGGNNADSSSSSSSSGPDSAGKQGNADVQDALADILDMEIRKSKVKQDIMDDLELRKQKLREIGDQLTEDFGKEIELDKMRMDLASNMAMAETMEKFQQLEDEVQAVRDQLKADKRDLAAWEKQATAARNKGLFFQRLHKADAPSEEEEGEEQGRPELSEAAKAAVRQVSEPARKEVNSPWRLYLFVYLGAISTAVVVEDVLSTEPSYAIDLLYTAIAAVMAYNVWSERKEVMEGGSSSGGGDSSS